MPSQQHASSASCSSSSSPSPAAASSLSARIASSSSSPSTSPPCHRRRLLLARLPCRTLSACISLLILALSSSLAAADDGWRSGRATYYGNDGGATLNQGSCMYGDIEGGSAVSTGANIAALADKNDDFGGSCGRCYEVACDPAYIHDGYGQGIDRKGSCYSGKTVTVTITDTCPCDYPANAYSNRRWCCGDMYHMDLSTQAFGQIANTGDGVIGIKFRQVECPGGFKPSPRSASWDFLAGNSGR